MIQNEKNKECKLKTKLLLLQNYFQKKSEDKTEETTVDPGTEDLDSENCSFLLEKRRQYTREKSKHSEVLCDRINVIKESMELTKKYTNEKISRLIKENSILRQEL